MFKAIVIAAFAVWAGSNGYRYDGQLLTKEGKPAVGQAVKVCAGKSGGAACRMAAIFVDKEMKVHAANPIIPDARGVYSFYAPCGNYILRLSSGDAMLHLGPRKCK